MGGLVECAVRDTSPYPSNARRFSVSTFCVSNGRNAPNSAAWPSGPSPSRCKISGRHRFPTTRNVTATGHGGNAPRENRARTAKALFCASFRLAFVFAIMVPV